MRYQWLSRQWRDKLWAAWFVVSRPFRVTYKAKVCGHRTQRYGLTTSYGVRYSLGLPLKAHGGLDYCLDCVGAMAARCGWCGGTIYVGDYVTLYVPRSEMPEHTVYHQDDPDDVETRAAVGCQRTTCAETGADYCGQWVPPGRVARFPSVIERMLGAMKKGEECPVIMAHF